MCRKREERRRRLLLRFNFTKSGFRVESKERKKAKGKSKMFYWKTCLENIRRFQLLLHSQFRIKFVY